MRTLGRGCRGYHMLWGNGAAGLWKGNEYSRGPRFPTGIYRRELATLEESPFPSGNPALREAPGAGH